MVARPQRKTMNAILDIIVPVFGTVAVGWLIGRSKLLSPEGLRGLTNVTFYALFPALLFRSMSKVRIEALSFDILFVFFGTSLLLFFASLPLAPRLRHEAGRGHRVRPGGVFSNGVGIGIPFISYAFGDAGPGAAADDHQRELADHADAGLVPDRGRRADQLARDACSASWAAPSSRC